MKYLLRSISLAGALALAGLAGNAQAALITHPGLATTAGSCYLGCGNPRHDSSNILDGDWGQTGNTGLNSWNSGYWGGWVQVDFGASYVLDRIELYGWVNTYDPFTLLVSSNGSSWSTLPGPNELDRQAPQGSAPRNLSTLTNLSSFCVRSSWA